MTGGQVPSGSGTYTWRGRRLAYETYGTGEPVVVLLHGLLMDTRIYRRTARELAALGHHVVLLDLLGHGESDKPVHAVEYRIDVYGDQVVALLDHLGVDRAVIGGMSLGANVSLHVAAHHPDRVLGLVLEMPVLERAVPAAAMTFVPLLLLVHVALPVVRVLGKVAGLVSRLPSDFVASGLAPLTKPPEATRAILHGILVGPTVPPVEDRRAVVAPALVLGHKADLIHPFNDAEALVRQLRDARLVQASSLLEMRLRPARLHGEIDRFLTEIERRSAGPLSATGS
ncbi:MAG TPA: alpha/beta hydrolase [Acidimicrobiales bacterium]|nr:alpha/beta hydrolase [Acidimicrobiales bacterium]